MMRLTINQLLLTLFLIGFTGKIVAQTTRARDLSLWPWLQVEWNLKKKQYVEFQYQARFNENISQFNRSNLYFIYGKSIGKRWQFETLYQANLNHFINQNTLFAGVTYKKKLPGPFSLYYRTAFQYIRNSFTGIYTVDHPYLEWRNRLRFIYRMNNLFSTSISAEPYLRFNTQDPTHFTRIRYVWNVSYAFNKYQNFTVFYLIQPDISYSTLPKTNYAIGLTYHIRIPDKTKDFQKFFNPKSLDSKGDNDKDTQN